MNFKLRPKQRKAYRHIHLALIGVWGSLSLVSAILTLMMEHDATYHSVASLVSLLAEVVVGATLLSGGVLIVAGGMSYLRQPWMIAKLALIGFAIIIALFCKLLGPSGSIVSAAVVLPILLLTGWMSHEKPLNYLTLSGKHTATGDPTQLRPYPSQEYEYDRTSRAFRRRGRP